MNIKSIKAYQKTLALKKPYTISRETFTDTVNIFLEIELSNGMIGLGAACPEYEVVGETPEQTLKNLQSDLVLQLAGRDIRAFNGLIGLMQQHFAAFPGTMAAIDIALHDAFCQFLGISVVDFYGRHHNKMLTSITIGIKGVSETLEEAKEYQELGFKALKVKTGMDEKEDAERIIKLREKFGAYFDIRVDANTGYSTEQLTYFLKETYASDIEVIEQPFLPGKEAELLAFSEQERLKFTADESLTDLKSAINLTRDVPFGIFNIKLMKCGGIRSGLEIARVAQQKDIGLFWGCNDESMISITAALHAAFSCPNTKYLDLDGSFDLAEDLVADGFTLDQGFLSLNEKSGLGLTRL
jgi:L-alanine-DL-glutamate epimerase-like enolase superfamily enzyme